MQQKSFVLQNKGMNRDLSVSKAGESSAYENRNIRITATDNDTLLSVTNERGNRLVPLYRSMIGKLAGWNVLNGHILLFMHDDACDGDYVDADGRWVSVVDGSARNDRADRIYRVDYDGDGFDVTCLYHGNLNLSLRSPIESVVDYESDNVQKIYWVDGRNVLRFMNFMDDPSKWANDDRAFDTNRPAGTGVSMSLSKNMSGNTRANGVVQYFLTYFNKYGQETGWVLASDLVYLSPERYGGSPDGTNVNGVTISLTGLDTSFSHFRIYSVFRSSVGGTPVVYLVAEDSTSEGEAVVSDDGSPLATEDSTRILYLGSRSVVAGTLAHKDGTLFLGDLKSVGRKRVDGLESFIRENFVEDGVAKFVSFEYSQGVEDGDSRDDRRDIPYVKNDGTYTWDSQLSETSSVITTFKGGEKYRFAIQFRTADGVSSDAFWIGDRENPLYPVINTANDVIRRPIAVLDLSTVKDGLVEALAGSGYVYVQLMIAEATYADRGVKAQGIVNPTMFNVWERYNDRLYSMASWISRPRHSGFAWKHFQPVMSSDMSLGEIECNYWEGDDPVPYYRLQNYTFPDVEYYEPWFDTEGEFETMAVIVYIQNLPFGKYHMFGFVITGKSSGSSHVTDMRRYVFDMDDYDVVNGKFVVQDEFEYKVDMSSGKIGKPDVLWAELEDFLDGENVRVKYRVPKDVFAGMCEESDVSGRFFSAMFGSSEYQENFPDMLNFDGTAVQTTSVQTMENRWFYSDGPGTRNHGRYLPAYMSKNLMFVDENVVTLNSPEFEQEVVNVDGADLGFRIIGVAKMSSVISDYTVDASSTHLPAGGLVRRNFTSEDGDGLVSWPLWEESGLDLITEDRDEDGIPDIKDRTSSDYKWGGGIVKYWLHMWNHLGKVNGFTDADGNSYSELNNKVFANLRFSYATLYNGLGPTQIDLDCGRVRMFNSVSSQYVGIDIDGERKFYDANIDTSLSMPQGSKYPILHSYGDVSSETIMGNEFLYSDAPTGISFLSSPHAVIPLKTESDGHLYTQTLLPWIFSSEKVDVETGDALVTGFLLPWEDMGDGEDEIGETVKAYSKDQRQFTLYRTDYSTESLGSNDRYLFIGELYEKYSDGNPDMRYGGTSEAAVHANRFIPAGPQYVLGDVTQVYGNRGDTFFQRWDCLKTMPFSNDAVNGVIDVTSFMVETHVNIDGRYDHMRGTGKLASIDVSNFGKVNQVYSQPDDYIVGMDLDSKFNLDSYRSSLTWTLQKSADADVDEWTHITLASSMQLDGDKGICRAIRRVQNSLLAFQDKGISEILFNSRTQLSTKDGVPVELANSGRVEGKRYLTNTHGVTNKWSIVEGKSGLYFVDSINKAFCAANFSSGSLAIDGISDRLGFGVWFRRNNEVNPWEPVGFDNIVSFYDRIHSEMYMVRKEDGSDEAPCLAYNEKLGVFTSFYDYGSVPMMANVGDRFVSFRDGNLWLQNEGLYCRFFGSQYGFWTTYRAVPDPFGDKIWTNLEYRADAYRVLDEEGGSVVEEKDLLDGGEEGLAAGDYRADETFDELSVWNEYQKTGNFAREPVKKFRIWRVAIPRALKTDSNRHGLDRIRNPWINVKFKRSYTGQHDDTNQDLMQLHDITVKYFE